MLSHLRTTESSSLSGFYEQSKVINSLISRCYPLTYQRDNERRWDRAYPGAHAAGAHADVPDNRGEQFARKQVNSSEGDRHTDDGCAD